MSGGVLKKVESCAAVGDILNRDEETN